MARDISKNGEYIKTTEVKYTSFKPDTFWFSMIYLVKKLKLRPYHENETNKQKQKKKRLKKQTNLRISRLLPPDDQGGDSGLVRAT